MIRMGNGSGPEPKEWRVISYRSCVEIDSLCQIVINRTPRRAISSDG